MQSHGAVLKGVEVDSELAISDALRHLKAGSTRPAARSQRHRRRASFSARGWRKTPACGSNDNISVVSPEGGVDAVRPAPGDPPLQGVRDLRNRLLRYRRYLGVHFHRRRAEGAVARGRDQPDRAQSGRPEPRAGDRPRRGTRRRAAATPPPPGRSATSNCLARCAWSASSP